MAAAKKCANECSMVSQRDFPEPSVASSSELFRYFLKALELVRKLLWEFAVCTVCAYLNT